MTESIFIVSLVGAIYVGFIWGAREERKDWINKIEEHLAEQAFFENPDGKRLIDQFSDENRKERSERLARLIAEEKAKRNSG